MIIKRLMNSVYKFSKKIFDPLYKLDGLQDNGQVIILHISDTPDIIYSFIFKIIDRLKPNIIVHTGDIVDNVKLASGGSQIAYKRSLQRFVEELNKRDWAEKYIIPGNHDSIDFIKEIISDDIYIKEEGTVINIEGINIGVAHFKEELPGDTVVSLYGHDKSTIDGNGNRILNGLVNINIILLPSQEVYKLSYPARTDNGRHYKRLRLP